MEKGRLYDIHCPSCGAPAYYDIRKRIYHCSYSVPLTPVFLVKYGRMDIYDNLGILFLFCTMVYLTAFGFGE